LETKKIKLNDYVEIDYTGRLKDGDIIFDTTAESVAKENNLTTANAKFGPVIVCIGKAQLLPGLDKRLEGKDVGKHSFELEPEDAFGKKSAQLLKLVPMKIFKQQGITPFVGLEINVDNSMGVVRSVSGGRVIVDFNHPLSGRELIYDIDVKRIVTDDKEKIEALLELSDIGFEEVTIAEKKAVITLNKDLDKTLEDLFIKEAEESIGLKEIEFKSKQ